MDVSKPLPPSRFYTARINELSPLSYNKHIMRNKYVPGKHNVEQRYWSLAERLSWVCLNVFDGSDAGSMPG